MWGNAKAEWWWWWCEILVSHMHIAYINIELSRSKRNEQRREILKMRCESVAHHTEKRTIGKYLCMCRLGACSYTFEYTAYKSALLRLSSFVHVCVCIPYPHVFVRTVCRLGIFRLWVKSTVQHRSTRNEFVCEYVCTAKWRMTCTHANSKWKWALNIHTNDDCGYNFYELNGKANTAVAQAVVVSTVAAAANRKCMTVQHWQCLRIQIQIQIQWQPQSRSIALHCSIQKKRKKIL